MGRRERRRGASGEDVVPKRATPGGIFRQPSGNSGKLSESSPARRKIRQCAGSSGSREEFSASRRKIRWSAGRFASPSGFSPGRRKIRQLVGIFAGLAELSPTRRSFRRIAGIFGKPSEDSPARRDFRCLAGRFADLKTLFQRLQELSDAPQNLPAALRFFRWRPEDSGSRRKILRTAGRI
jgi:hypothetical protein